MSCRQDIELEPILDLEMLNNFARHKRSAEPATPARANYPPTEKLLEALRKEDAKVAKFVTSREGVLRYIMTFTVCDREAAIKCSIKPTFVKEDHPLYRMIGSEIYAAFTLERSSYPIVMRGAQGAGSESSSGILNDVLKIAQRLSPH